MARLIQVGEALTVEDLRNLPAGSVLRDDSGELIKQPPRPEWVSEDGTESIAVNAMEKYVESWHPVLVSVPDDETP